MRNRRRDDFLGVETTRRGLFGLAAATAGVALIRRLAVAADDRPEQKRLAQMSVLERGAEWLQAQQLADGGYPNVMGQPDPGSTLDAISTLVALRNVGLDVETADVASHLEAHAAELNELARGGEGRLVFALVPAGADPRDFGGVDLVERIIASWDAAAGSFGIGDPALHFFALLGLAAAGEEIPNEAIATIAATQIEDGSWSYGGGTDPGSGDSLITGLVVQALAAAGHRRDQMVADAIAYLHGVRDAGGAFGYGFGASPDSLTTAFVVSALNASGERRTGETWKPTVDALIAFQNESGAFRHSDADLRDDIQATIGALLALAGGSLPVIPTA